MSEQQVREWQAIVAAKDAEIDDWLLVADGVKHDPRCPNNFVGNTNREKCLRCQLETANATLDQLRAVRAEEKKDVNSVVALLAVERAKLAEAQREIAAIEKVVPPPGNTGIELLDRVIGIVVQSQHDDQRCRVWEAEIVEVRSALAAERQKGWELRAWLNDPENRSEYPEWADGVLEEMDALGFSPEPPQEGT